MTNQLRNNYSVYKHTSPSGKVYIGITCQKPERRWRNGEGYKAKNGEQTAFYKAIMKYGWENIQHEIIASEISKNEACEMEIKLIAEYNSQNSQYGYNVLNGGDIPLENCPDEVREHMRNSSYAKWQKESYIKSHTGDEHWTHKKGYSRKSVEAMRKSNLGRKRTPEQIEFLRKKAKEQKRKYGKDNKKSIPILCFSKDWEYLAKYYGFMEAGRQTGISFQNIALVCKGKRKTAGGYVWKYDIGGNGNAVESQRT